MAKHVVEVLEAFEVVSPATVLETRLSSDGPVVQTIPVPESRFSYTAGQTFTFNNKRDRDAFLRAHGSKVRLKV